MYRKILVSLDGSDVANCAFESALQLAKAENAELVPLYVVEYPNTYAPNLEYDPAPIYDALLAEGERVREKADACMAKEGVRGHSQVADNFPTRKTVAAQIQDAADACGADLVVMGTHGRSGFHRLVLGSVAEAFIRLSTRPVLLIPQKASAGVAAKE